MFARVGGDGDGKIGASHDNKISGNVIYRNALRNLNGAMSGGGWLCGMAYSYQSNTRISGNVSYGNRGEGFAGYLNDSVTITGNVAYDNFSVSFWVRRGRNTHSRSSFRRRRATSSPSFGRTPAPGIFSTTIFH